MQLDDGFQEIDLFFQLFHTAFRGKRFEKRLLAFSEQIELRRRLSVCRDECKQQLFQEVEQKLKDYRKDPSYEEYLFGKYKKALAFAGDDTIELILSSGDAAFAKSLEKKLSHAITVSDEDFGGGIRAVIEARNIQIDDSFSSMMEAERQSYIYEGGVTHE